MPKAIQVIVDGIIYERQSRGGISNLFSEILPRMCKFNSSLKITVFHSSRLMQKIPQHEHIEIIKLPPFDKLIKPGRYFYKAQDKMRIKNANWYLREMKGAIWHSTYFTDIEKWQGPKVVTIYDMIYERFPELFNRPYNSYFREQKRQAILQADRILCISHATMNELCQHLPIDQNRCAVTHLACDDSFYQENNAPENSIPYLLFVGRRYHYKNFSFLLKTFRDWKYANQVQLIVAGEETWGKEERLSISSLGLEGRVVLEQNVENDRLRQLYNGALAFIYPSLFEGFGLPLLEAMNLAARL